MKQNRNAAAAAAIIATTTVSSSYYAYQKIQEEQSKREAQQRKIEEARRRKEEEERIKNASVFQVGAKLLNSVLSVSLDDLDRNLEDEYEYESVKNYSGKEDKEEREEGKGSNSIWQNLTRVTPPLSSHESKDSKHHKDKNDNDNETSIASLAKSFSSLLTGEISQEEFSQFIHAAQSMTQKGDVNETRSALDLLQLFLEKQNEVKQHIVTSLGETLDLKEGGGWIFDPTSMFYYLEREDSVKHPSWKRRKHRYFKGVDVSLVTDLNYALFLAEVAYYDSKEKIQSALKRRQGDAANDDANMNTNEGDKTTPNQKNPAKSNEKHHTSDNDTWELVYCQLDSLPEQPSHYVAVKRGQSRWSPNLEVLMVVRGTSTIPDILTDALLDDEDYRNGRAHAGILRSGKYLARKHSGLMEHLMELSKKKGIKLTLVGHSLGAGAAAIAGMEFREDERFDVNVVGFGCPAILSKELSESTKDYVTTVIGDADVVPRMSAETIGNLMLDMMEYDWTPMARRDIKEALQEVQKNMSFLFKDDSVESIMGIVDTALEKYAKPKILVEHSKDSEGSSKEQRQRMETILYPPGTCIHFYRDGASISGSYVPCDFFNEIDLSRTMVEDHFVWGGYRKIFLEVMRSFLSDNNFRFDEK